MIYLSISIIVCRYSQCGLLWMLSICLYRCLTYSTYTSNKPLDWCKVIKNYLVTLWAVESRACLFLILQAFIYLTWPVRLSVWNKSLNLYRLSWNFGIISKVWMIIQYYGTSALIWWWRQNVAMGIQYYSGVTPLSLGFLESSNWVMTIYRKVQFATKASIKNVFW